MMKILKNLALYVCAGITMFGVSDANAVTYTYVGSWYVDSGPYWANNPPVYSGQEAAAFLFGGNASDYAISTLGTDVNSINFMAYYDGWGDNATCGTNGPCAQDLHVDVDGDGYEFPGGTDTAFSALVSDHGLHLANYAFAVTQDVPEPATWAMMIGGLGLVGGALRRKRASLRLA